MRHLALLVLCLSGLRAEISPDGYRKLQADAPEALVIEVTKVSVATTLSTEGKTRSVTAQAKVRDVRRSASGLRKDSTLTLRYTINEPLVPMPGPSQPRLLKEGETTPAFLRPSSEGAFGLAAYGRSFEGL